MHKSMLATCLFAVGVFAAGCSSSKGSQSDPPSAASSSTATSASAAPSSAASSAAGASGPLAMIVVQPADLGVGWTAAAHEDDPEDAANQAALLQCAGITKSTVADKVDTANSPDYSQNGASVSSSATTYKTQADVEADTAVLNNPKISGCYEQLFQAQLAKTLPAGSSVTAVKIEITPGTNGGPANVAAIGGGTITATVSGKSVTIYLGVAFITGPLLEAEVDFENPTQPVPTAIFSGLVTAVATRAAKG
ncbi:MAG: hypothetical protein JWM76_718 [Pseudonocardiales bacterium]|nr:hypothetical protein [Pseudonocardiales bacterium]